MRPRHASEGLFREIGVFAAVFAALIVASIAGGLNAPGLWTLATILAAGYLLARGASRGSWQGLYGLRAPAREETGRQSHAAGDPAQRRASGTEAVTVSEERLQVDKRSRVRERVRVHKYVVTEQVTVTVPVRQEHLRLVREPITPDGADAGIGELGESAPDYEITLLEERVVVDKRVVPRERVTVSKEVVTDKLEISETVRREQVEFERDGVRQSDLSPTEEE